MELGATVAGQLTAAMAAALARGKGLLNVADAEVAVEFANIERFAQNATLSDNQLARIAKLLADNVECLANSFAPGTRVLLADGTTEPIEAIKPGDLVANSPPGDAQLRQHAVTAVHVTDDDTDFVDLRVETRTGVESITTTARHLFWERTTRSWVPAAGLKPNQQLETPGAGRASVVAARPYKGAARTFNLTVDAVLTYYVLAGHVPVLVHNANSKCRPIALGKSRVNGDPMALHDFADSHGAAYYAQWASEGENWVSEFKSFVMDGETPIYFNLSGIDNPVALANFGRGKDPIFDENAATAWELNFIREHPEVWDRVKWFKDGAPETNPFG